MIQNPILKGFNPDPSIIRVGDDFYIATSTFEWFPGVQVHHSKDLVNWELITRPLDRLSQLDLCGVPDSGGVWAPCLSYDKGVFYLVYSNVHSFQGVWKDTPNYLVTSTDIKGPWSDPVFLSSSGFDGSLFHDQDGKKYYLSMIIDHRKGKFFGGITLQEFDPQSNSLTGEVHHIFSGSELGLTEGPHIYQKDGFYFLLTAEGGTEYGHAVTTARSTKITGPYITHPDNPIMTAKDHPKAPLQKTGHADLVETKEGKWYMVFLTGRPLSTLGRCTLGRETGIEEVVWTDEHWPILKNGTKLARENISIADVIPDNSSQNVDNIQFSPPELDMHFQSLRIPIADDWCSLSERPGYLRLYGQESLSSLHRQSIIARRVQSFHIEAETSIDFHPKNFQQMAGLVCYYNTYHWIYLHLAGSETQDRLLDILVCDKYNMREVLRSPIQLPNEVDIYLKASWQRGRIQFYYAIEKNNWIKAGPELDGSILSDDYVRDEKERYRPAFTGAFVGMCCQDLTGSRIHADFKYWKYAEFL